MRNLNERYLAAKQRLFEKYYGLRLNDKQTETVFSVKGPLLVLAGAGSGKTTVLVNRIAYIIKYGNAYYSEDVPEGVTEGTVKALEYAEHMTAEEINEILPEFISEPCPPWAVLAITFTNKAAREIKERLAKAFSDKSVTDFIWAGTFHSVCLRILRKYADRLGYRDGFSIYDTDDKKRMIALCMDELNIDEKRLAPKAVANAISMAKDSLISAADYQITHDPRSRDIQAIYRLYQRKMLEYNALDFDDIIMRTVELLTQDAEVREYYQNKFKFVLVDEYQDTNHAQFVLTKLLSDKYRNIMVVGDDDQSIYRFRGATVENILDFDKTYPDAKVVKLEENYRSTGNILEAANAVIKNNGKRRDKRLWCRRGDGEKIVVREALNQQDEGKYIINKIVEGVKEGGRYSDYAILYRINELARSLETSFTKSGIPYKILGGMRFYDRKEIKDIIAYLVLLTTDSDNLRLKRIINEPKRKIGAATVSGIEEIAATLGVSMLEVVRRAGEFTSLAKSRDKLLEFAALIDSIKADSPSPSAAIERVFNDTGYRKMLESEGFEGEGKIKNVEELISGAVEFEGRMADAGEEADLVSFLEEISLVSDVDKYDEDADAVVLMTIHSAKGLEFPNVFLAGMEDGIFPSQQNLSEPEEMSEERRLAYVAITRAKERLYITYSKERMLYGRTSYGQLSRFVREEIPKSLVLHEKSERRIPPPRSTFGSYNRENYSRPDYMKGIAKSAPTAPRGAEKFGLQRFTPGTRVSHPMFGDGTVVSAKDMGGDLLYEVRFDSGEVKRLMATFARLKKI